MDAKGRILKYLREAGGAKGRELVALLGVSRQALNRHLQQLVQEGAVVKEGVTRGASYRLATSPRDAGLVPVRYTRTLPLPGLQEDLVYREVAQQLNLQRALNRGVSEIARYAFTEMLNNAVDHSKSERAQVRVLVSNQQFRFEIRDPGIGVFYSIAEKFGLPDEYAALGELLKGKTTTMRKRHTGEGIFFTSKVADRFVLRSHRLELVYDGRRQDVFVREARKLRGTRVVFEISRRSKRKLNMVFEAYAPEDFDYQFQRTRVRVKLFQDEYMSRSEARRLLTGLDKFREVILDFKGVHALGQGFADEIFRVFVRNHPQTWIGAENTNRAIVSMIRHVDGDGGMNDER